MKDHHRNHHNHNGHDHYHYHHHHHSFAKLLAELLRNRLSILNRTKELFLQTAFKPALWPTQAPVQRKGEVSRCNRAAGCEADHSYPFNVEFKNQYSCSAIPSFAFMACAGTNLPVIVVLVLVVGVGGGGGGGGGGGVVVVVVKV